MKYNTIITIGLISLVTLISGQAYTAIVVGQDCSYGVAYSPSRYIAIRNAYRHCLNEGCIRPSLRQVMRGGGFVAVAEGSDNYTGQCRFGYDLNNLYSEYDARRIALVVCNDYGRGNCYVDHSWRTANF